MKHAASLTLVFVLGLVGGFLIAPKNPLSPGPTATAPIDPPAPIFIPAIDSKSPPPVDAAIERGDADEMIDVIQTLRKENDLLRDYIRTLKEKIDAYETAVPKLKFG